LWSANGCGRYILTTSHSLRSILDRLLLIVQTSARKLHAAFGADVARRPGYRQALIDASTITNAALSAYSIQQEFGTSEPAGLRAVFGVYLLETREVWVPRLGNTKDVGFAAAPNDLAGFIDLGNAIVQSDRIASHIK
jgi:carbonic anhydrase